MMQKHRPTTQVPAKRRRDDDRGNLIDDNSFARKQSRINQQQEAQQMREWVSQEDEFVLKQANKAAIIRVKEGRAKPIDWLAVILQLVEPLVVDEENDLDDIEVMNPEAVFDDLKELQLLELDKNIKAYKELEKDRKHRDFWETMSVICKNRQIRTQGPTPTDRAVNTVSGDVDRLLSGKSYEDLVALEIQIRQKLESDEAIDVDYWEHLLRSLVVWKARAKLKSIYHALNDGRVTSLQKQQRREADAVREKLSVIMRLKSQTKADSVTEPSGNEPREAYPLSFDPEPLLKLHSEDKALDMIDEREFLERISVERQKVAKLGYLPMKQRQADKKVVTVNTKPSTQATNNRFATASSTDDFSQATKALYEREVARGVNEDEEIFAGEETIKGTDQPKWADKHRPRKPKYFNRVQMGYEWNKYNQTHYNHDSPPPKVVQGYKFNIFYPDLIDKSKAPTYRIEREHGRKKGQSFAPAGEEDTCLIRFVSGAPYEDIAFRIVDKEWDYSAKRERGFKSSFDKGILQLHFQFKKIYYRK